ncbi:MAG: hypothetical protein HLUCCA08_04080 [Rhodobacteraceae bacterium HLUCCA08]|nr:MAG: hypothetical protein HLUCCA08_04080 [Rhodobacteraceae bacterium HLUCCA08]
MSLTGLLARRVFLATGRSFHALPVAVFLCSIVAALSGGSSG